MGVTLEWSRSEAESEFFDFLFFDFQIYADIV